MTFVSQEVLGRPVTQKWAVICWDGVYGKYFSTLTFMSPERTPFSSHSFVLLMYLSFRTWAGPKALPLSYTGYLHQQVRWLQGFWDQ